MKELGLQELLRYALSGCVGIASLLLMYPNVACLIGDLQSAGEVTLLLGAILVVGTLIYNVHRALLFPIFFRVIGLITLPSAKGPLWWFFWRPSEAETQFDHWRWALKDRRRWDDWGAQTHFLYCAAWATLAAFIFGRYAAGPPSCRAWHIFGALFGISLSAAVINNYRLLYSVTAERKREKEHLSALLK